MTDSRNKFSAHAANEVVVRDQLQGGLDTRQEIAGKTRAGQAKAVAWRRSVATGDGG